MDEELAGEIAEASRQRAAGELLVVTVYDADDIRHEYVIDEVCAQSDRIALDSLHRPIRSIHRTLELVGQLNELGGSHQGSIHFYEHVTYLHFRTGEQSGVIVSLDPRGDRHEEVYAQCRALLSDDDDAS